MGLFVPFQPAADEYPNYLAASRPERVRLRSARWLLLALLLACLIPRAVMALRIPSVCPDGVLYVRTAQAMEAGNWRSAFKTISPNSYPVILMLLHRTGLDWELAASLWGVTVSSLVVLPLWGWVRRQFDDRVALVTCLLYAVHPKFIEWSPEVMRDPTFWLVFVLAIYWIWRAVTEVHYGYFIAGGAALTLAVMTRIEGLFLLIPLSLWTFWRYRALETDRRKLLFGAALCVVAFPSLLVLANVGWLFGHSGFAALKLSPLGRIQPWLASMTGHVSAGTHPDVPAKPLTIGQMLWVFFPTMTRGLSPVYALLMFGGLLGWRRVWARRDHQPLFYVAVAVICGIWIQLWYDRTICPRYALPIVLMASPFAALGLLWLVQRSLWLVARLRLGVRGQRITVAAVATIVVGINLTDAMTSNGKYFETRRMAADMGCWVRDRYSTPPRIVGPMGITPIVSFYANDTPYQTFRWEAGDASILAMVNRSRAGVVLLQSAKQLTDERCDALATRLKEAGLEEVDRSALPTTCNELSVLVRTKPSPRVAREPSRTY
jgi:4-amino-4-deoxy-L-arabinose transferase-like glycosyltransferase